MKHFTLKKIMFFLSILFISTQLLNAVNHGSIKGTGLKMYSQYNAGTMDPSTEKAGVTFDYKVVTIGSKSWAWTKVTGATVGGATWASQLRYWTSANAKTENNLLLRVAGATNSQTYGTTTSTIPSPLKLTFYQNLTPGGDSETERIDYDITTKNSAVSGDVTPPTISSLTSSNVTETTATLNITGSDDQSDLFYYITGNGIEEVSFLPTFNLTGLSASTAYTITVTPIDFSGNEGTPQNVSFTTVGLVQITSGIAKEIKFVLKSTATRLEYYYEFTDASKTFRDAFIKITPSGGTEFEIKPTISPDGKYAFGVTTDSRIANKVLDLNCGYFVFVPGDPVWENYVVDNKVITAGSLSGTPIKHQMGGGIANSEKETTAPVLNSVTLKDVTSSNVLLNIDGSDNSGTVYYTITGAKSTVNAFHTGDYYLTAIDPGKVYNLTLTPYDLSGNSGTPKTLTVKTMNARSNIAAGSTGVGYNNVAPSTDPELVVTIAQSGNTLTLGCTTVSDLITNAAWKNRVFNTPTVKIDGVSYPLTLDANGNIATATFTDVIGSKSIVPGTSFDIQWSVFWGATGGGNFYTGTYTYVIGDNGQADEAGPSKPALTLAGSELTWTPFTDDLTGVKWYEVTEEGQPTVKIFDVGEATFAYTLINPLAKVSVVAIDFAGNASPIATVNDETTSTKNIQDALISIYPNPATDVINLSSIVNNIAVYSVSGQKLMEMNNTNRLEVSDLSEGVYLISITDKEGLKKSAKIQIVK